MNPRTLSEIDFNVDGYTADDVIEGRKATRALVNDAANRGMKIAILSRELDMLATAMGIDPDYNEELDDDE